MGRLPLNKIDVERQTLLFEFGDPPVQRSVVKLRPLRNPIWTENKARLIERYLYYFVLITKHGPISMALPVLNMRTGQIRGRPGWCSEPNRSG